MKEFFRGFNPPHDEKKTAFQKKIVSKKHFNPEHQFQTTVLVEKWIKIFLRFLSSTWCDLRPTQYGVNNSEIWHIPSLKNELKKTDQYLS